ncbi:MAG: ATP-binding protein [Ignavibacteria bacterium]|nr:ATP-binding protein [Ignavibacteria bacterium]
MEIVENNIVRTGDIIKRSAHYSMLLNRREDVHQIINTIGNEPEVVRINVYNKRGVISFSDLDSLEGTKVDMNSYECYPCHSAQNPKLYLTSEERTRIFKGADGNRVIGLIIPIENQPECSNSICHAHDPGQRILGVIDVQMSLEWVDNALIRNRKTYVLNALFITTIVSLFSGIFIWLMVHTRVRDLIKGTKEIAKGNYDFRIKLYSNDEFGELSKHFNEMSEHLKKALNEIKSLNESLNIKVKEKTEQLKNIYDHVNQIERIASLGKLSATVAHELNNPLEGILTYSKLIIRKLNNGITDEDKKKIISYLELIASESERCGNIVKNLLLFSRTSEKNISVNDLISIIERSLMLINHHLQLNNIQLERDYCCNYIEFECDKNQIQQALLAILINAVEAMPEGGKLTVKVYCTDSFVNVDISDTGVGIPKEHLNKIFEPFFSTKTGGKGTGLGLSVVYGIVKQHQGRINIESEVNKGTTVKLIFPKKIIGEIG